MYLYLYVFNHSLVTIHPVIFFWVLLNVGETGAKSNRGEMQQSQYLAQVMSLGTVIHNVVVQFDNPPFHPKMAGEMLSYRIFSSKN